MLTIKMLGEFAFVLNNHDISSKLSSKTAVLLALLFSHDDKKSAEASWPLTYGQIVQKRLQGIT